MNLIWRIVSGNHIEMATSSSKPFTLEWDSSSTVMFNTLASIREMPKLEGLSMALRTFSGLLRVYLRFK